MMGSPLNYFDANTGGRQGMFQMGAQIGALNSPASGPTSAIKQVLERARAWTDKQQTQQMAMELEKSKFGMGQGLKTAYATKAQEALAGLRGKSGVEGDIVYHQGARYMKDPMGTERQLISNAAADDTSGTADWGPWGYAPAEDKLGGIVDRGLPSTEPRVNWPLGQNPDTPLPGNGGISTADPYAGMTPTERKIAQKLGI